MENLPLDPGLFFLFIAVVMLGAGVYFADIYRQMMVKDRKIDKMIEFVDALLRGYEGDIAQLLSFLEKHLSQDSGVLGLLEAQKTELRTGEQVRVWKFQRLRSVSRRLFEVLDAHPELKDPEVLNSKKGIYDAEETITLAAQNHDAFTEAFNIRLRQLPEKWFATKFHISPRQAIWSAGANKRTI